MNYEDLLVEKKDGVATITLNAPDKLNAVSRKMRASLLLAVDELDKDDGVKVVILTGAGRGFCPGADVSELRDAPREEPSRYERLNGMAKREIASFFKMDKPVIAAINGACVGLGFCIALSCDIRIASEKAKFGSGFIQLGAVPHSGLTYMLPRIVGTGKALQILLTGELIGAVEAEKMGIVNRVVPPEELMKVSQELALKMAQYYSIALELTKRVVYRSIVDDIAHQYDWEAWAGQMARQTQDSK